MSVSEAIVPLPVGVWLDGVRLRQAGIRAVNGEDEMWLAEQSRPLTTPERISGLLRRCAPTLPEGAERLLTVGDRETLCLHVRRMSFGETIPSVLHCPTCAARMDLDLEVSSLLVDPPVDAAPTHEADGVEFRLPNGGDLEEAARVGNPAAAVRALLGRCVLNGAHLDDDAVTRLGTRMVELDPQAEMALDVRCSDCGHKFRTLFDAGAFLMREMAMRRTNLLREVHQIARHYHWSEDSILRLPRDRRHAYLELIAGDSESRRRP